MREIEKETERQRRRVREVVSKKDKFRKDRNWKNKMNIKVKYNGTNRKQEKEKE